MEIRAPEGGLPKIRSKMLKLLSRKQRFHGLNGDIEEFSQHVPHKIESFSIDEIKILSHSLQVMPFLISKFFFYLTHCRVLPVWV
jgi:hypothetical protein